MSTFRMKSTFIIALFMIITVSSFGQMFQGIIVAKLPFTPFSLLTNLTHRGIIFTYIAYFIKIIYIII